MVLAYRAITRLEHGEVVRPPDPGGTLFFASAYFVVWGLVSLATLVSLVALWLFDPMGGPIVLAGAVVLIAAGVYQVTRAKAVCLTHCQSPVGFVMNHWRSGQRGAWRMGVHHAAYCIGCCWLFMTVVFVAGAMSLVWMGAISLVIFVEMVGWRPRLVTRAIGVLLVVAGAFSAFQAASLV